jgi:hypothetical protein
MPTIQLTEAQVIALVKQLPPERKRAALLIVVTVDPDDDKVVECAVVRDATHIVTGDRRPLLPLGSFRVCPLSVQPVFWR